MLRVFRYVFFWFRSSFCGTFSVNSNPLFISVVGYSLWCWVVRKSLSFSEFFIRDYGVYSTCLSV